MERNMKSKKKKKKETLLSFPEDNEDYITRLYDTAKQAGIRTRLDTFRHVSRDTDIGKAAERAARKIIKHSMLRLYTEGQKSRIVMGSQISEVLPELDQEAKEVLNRTAIIEVAGAQEGNSSNNSSIFRLTPNGTLCSPWNRCPAS